MPNPPRLQTLLKRSTHPSHVHQLQAALTKSGLLTLPFPASKLLAATAALDLPHAVSLFAALPCPNLFMFNSLLRAHHHNLPAAFSFFNSLRLSASPDQFSFISTLKACANDARLTPGRQLHGLSVKSGIEFELNLRNMLVAFYFACGDGGDARKVFDERPGVRDVVSWGALASGYRKLGLYDEVVRLFLEMRKGGVEVSQVVLVGVAVACGSAMRHDFGGSVHAVCVKVGFGLVKNVASSLVTMYGRFGCMDSARAVFEDLPSKDVVLWNSMVDGYVRCGWVEDSLDLLREMQAKRLRPNAATVVGLLSVCASAGDLILGQRINEFAGGEMPENDPVLGTSLIDMYSKCGHIDKASEIFDKLKTKDVKSWTAMISGFGINGRPKDALACFYEMERERVKPNDVTFLALLSACRHGGLVVAAQGCLRSMVEVYHLAPQIEHYGCVLDLLGRLGMLEEAHELIKSLPVARDPVAWRALLSSCRFYGYVELGELAMQSLVALEEEHPTDSILLSSTYAVAGSPVDVSVLRDDAQRNRLHKDAGWSSAVGG